MKSLIGVFAILAVGCSSHSQYSLVKIGPDRYIFTGDDPSQLKSNAYNTCVKNGFYDYSIITVDRSAMTVRCEEKPTSFFSTVSDETNKAWEKVKKQIDEFRRNK